LTLARGGRERDRLAHPDHVPRTIHPPTVHMHVSVHHELARGGDGGGEAEPEDHIIQATLHQGEEVLAQPPRLTPRRIERATHLPFGEPVVEADLLLLLQPKPMRAGTTATPAPAMRARRERVVTHRLAGEPGELSAEPAEDLDT